MEDCCASVLFYFFADDLLLHTYPESCPCEYVTQFKYVFNCEFKCMSSNVDSVAQAQDDVNRD